MRQTRMLTITLALLALLIGTATASWACPGHGHEKKAALMALKGADVEVRNIDSGLEIRATSADPEKVKAIQGGMVALKAMNGIGGCPCEKCQGEGCDCGCQGNCRCENCQGEGCDCGCQGKGCDCGCQGKGCQGGLCPMSLLRAAELSLELPADGAILTVKGLKAEEATALQQHIETMKARGCQAH